MVGLVFDSDERRYRKEVERLVGWCSDNNLELNVSKTKEMILDFRKKRCPTPHLSINGVRVELVDSFKFLGKVISSDLSWAADCTSIVKRCHTRLHFLRQLRNFGLNQTILPQFYRSVVESIIGFGITVWFGGTASSEKNELEWIVRHASRIVGRELPSVASLYCTRLCRIGRVRLSATRHTQPIICSCCSPPVGVIGSLYGGPKLPTTTANSTSHKSK